MANTAALGVLGIPNQVGNAGNYLKTDGSIVAFDAIDVGTSDVTGTLPVNKGGTGVATITGIVLGNGTGATSATASVTASVMNQVSYTTAGSYTWYAPTGVTSVSVVAVGGGGNKNGDIGGAGGALGWRNNVSVTPGTGYAIVVGTAGVDSTCFSMVAGSGSGAAGGVLSGTYDGGGNGGYGGTGFGGGGGGNYGGGGGGQSSGAEDGAGGGGGSAPNAIDGASGGSGVVIVRYQYQ